MPDVTTFSLLDALTGRSYPTVTETLFIDAQSAFDLNELNIRLRDTTDQEAYEALNKKAQALARKVKASAVQIELRGISSAQIEQLRDEGIEKFKTDEDATEKEREDARINAVTWLNRALVAAHIVRVTQGKAVDEHVFTVADVEVLEDLLPESEWDRLTKAVTTLSFESTYFDESVTAGFLSRS